MMFQTYFFSVLANINTAIRMKFSYTGFRVHVDLVCCFIYNQVIINHHHILIYASGVFRLLFNIMKDEYKAYLLYRRPYVSVGR
jgi:hypothetical protein